MIETIKNISGDNVIHLDMIYTDCLSLNPGSDPVNQHKNLIFMSNRQVGD